MGTELRIGAQQTLQKVMHGFRAGRMQQFLRRFCLTAETSVLDVGGMPETWLHLPVRPNVTLLNMPRAGVRFGDRFAWVAADGCALPFASASYDLVFSNSVIEHVGGPDRQKAFAAEIGRVGRQYWVQTPNFWFPVEAHLLTPGVHFLPKACQRALVTRGSVWEWLERPSPDRRDFYVEHFLNEIQLLTAAEMGSLFPGATLLRERTLGMTKSLIACKTAKNV